MEKILDLHFKDENQIIKINKALSNAIRIKILDMLSFESLSVNEIARRLDSPISTVSGHIKTLEESGLINCIEQAGKHGSMKLCALVYEGMTLNFLSAPKEKSYNEKIYNISVGNYFSIDVDPTCGIASEKGFIGKDDDPSTFYSNERYQAQIIWFSKGFVEYRIPYEPDGKLENLEISMEVCSEAPYYRNEWPSDITLMINNVEVGTFTCPGDFGGRKGKYTPSWWSSVSSQFGLMKIFQINQEETTLDYKYISDVNLDRVFKNYTKKYISIKIGVKRDAKNIGGINIFGEKFGDYSTGIVVKASYSK